MKKESYRGAWQRKSDKQREYHQAEVSLRKAKATISSLFLKDFRNRTHIANLKLQLGGRKRRAESWSESQGKTSPTHGYQEGTTKIREQQEVGSQRSAVKAIRNFQQQDDQRNNLPILPSYQIRQRPFQELHQERQWNWQTWPNSLFSSSVWTGSQFRWSSSEWEDYHLISFYLQRVSLAGKGDSFVRDGSVNSTPHLARIHTRKFFSRVAHGSGSHCSVLCIRCLQNNRCLARMSCSARCLTRQRLHLHWALQHHLLYCSFVAGLPLALRKQDSCLAVLPNSLRWQKRCCCWGLRVAGAHPRLPITQLSRAPFSWLPRHSHLFASCGLYFQRGLANKIRRSWRNLRHSCLWVRYCLDHGRCLRRYWRKMFGGRWRSVAWWCSHGVKNRGEFPSRTRRMWCRAHGPNGTEGGDLRSEIPFCCCCWHAEFANSFCTLRRWRMGLFFFATSRRHRCDLCHGQVARFGRRNLFGV